MGLSLLMVSLLGYAALTWAIVRPLDRTIRTIEKVQSGDLAARVTPTGGRELREVAEAFNRLVRTLELDDSRIRHQITELKLMNQQLEQAHEKLVRSEKLASVGKLAAGVAHEIGNPIGIVLGYLDLLQRDVTPEQRAQYLGQAQEATRRISRIIRDLLDFARPGGDGTETGDAGRVIRATVQLLEPQKRFKNVSLTSTVPDDAALPVAIADNRLQQVLVNLLLNAADATSQETAPSIELSADIRDETVEIRVADNGPGVAEGDRRHIFDPFFTTKDPGEGTGLGLSICHGILTNHGGDIHVEPHADRGAVFVITCPRPAPVAERSIE